MSHTRQPNTPESGGAKLAHAVFLPTLEETASRYRPAFRSLEGALARAGRPSIVLSFAKGFLEWSSDFFQATGAQQDMPSVAVARSGNASQPPRGILQQNLPAGFLQVEANPRPGGEGVAYSVSFHARPEAPAPEVEAVSLTGPEGKTVLEVDEVSCAPGDVEHIELGVLTPGSYRLRFRWGAEDTRELLFEVARD